MSGTANANIFSRIFKRIFQVVALYIPGATTIRPALHRMRGVHIGENCFIGTDVILETEHPERIYIDRDVAISVRATFIAHFRGREEAARQNGSPYTIRVEKNVFIGPGAIILPFVTIGEGAVVSAGSVVTSSVAPKTLVQGNPARAVAICEVPLYPDAKHTYDEFLRNMKPIRRTKPDGA
jgi:acetyltransferase-like isoleucine patch superfamily enzyme